MCHLMLALHANLKEKPVRRRMKVAHFYATDLRRTSHLDPILKFKTQSAAAFLYALHRGLHFDSAAAVKKRKKEEEAMFPITFIVKDAAFLKFPDQSVAIFGCMVYQPALR